MQPRILRSWVWDPHLGNTVTAFNASLVIIVSFLGHQNLGTTINSSYFAVDSVFATLQQAISTMKALDNDNHTIDRCCYYLEQLVQVCANICNCECDPKRLFQ